MLTALGRCPKTTVFIEFERRRKKIPHWTISVPQAIALTVVEIVVANF